ncbi:adenylate cyclase type 9-like isoform X3 [Varroa destructor]|uniref:adenylate cyclase n=1 Tax=Varroa destructor TaxID=109461 RepID=A0A7M7IY77_VARDE|nr:adenylate cyclase type 9-like isoform X3 [Varroa destructor]
MVIMEMRTTGGTRRSVWSEGERISLTSAQLQHSLLQRTASLYPRRLSALQLFDRAAKASWWNPRFDSKVLEEQFRQSSFTQTEQHFRYALLYVILSALVYALSACTVGRDTWPQVSAACLVLALLSFSFLMLTLFRNAIYRRNASILAMSTLWLVAGFSLAPFALPPSPMEVEENHSVAVGSFSICLSVLVLSYTLVGPLPLYMICIFGVLYSTAFEIMSWFVLNHVNTWTILAVRILLQLSIHILGIKIRLLAETSMRNTFYKVGQSLLVRRELELEKHLKEKMIHSVMPPSVAQWLMKNTAEDGDEQQNTANSVPMHPIQAADRPLHQLPQPRSSNQLTFRPFNMHRMQNVSILFADIVGFTSMSSNKTAHQLVGLLNDLFGRFDFLCQKNGCEKISTLGDCYYCVSGCPEPRPDHAKCCVEMGLAMITAIREFDEDSGESVNMRVGIHTGTVLCGIVGTKRFKFDVWSNDVKYANRMESTGRPGKVHVSEVTHELLLDQYHFDEVPQNGEKDKKERKTYFIRHRKITGGRHSWPRFQAPMLARIGPQLSVDAAAESHPSQPMSGSSDPSDNSHAALNTRKASCPPLSEEANSDENDEDWIGEEVVFHPTLAQPLPWHHQANNQIGNQYDLHNPIVGDAPPLGAGGPIVIPGQPRRHSSLSTLYSRKDSGVVTARSSIQLESTAVEINVDRRGRTSTSTGRSSGVSSIRGYSIFGEDPALSFRQQIRKQSDLQMIRCIQQDCADAELFVHPPVHKLSLFFKDNFIERGYRDRLLGRELYPTLASPTFTVYLCTAVALIFYFVSLVTCFMLFPTPNAVFLSFCFVASFAHIAVAMVCLREILAMRGNWQANDCFTATFRYLMKWTPLHVVGLFLLCVPILAVFSNFACDSFFNNWQASDGFCLLSFAFLLHFTNFSQVKFWLRSLFATVAGLALVMFVGGVFCDSSRCTEISRRSYLCRNSDNIIWDILVHIILTSILVWLLNREFETSLRLSFHGGWLASQDQKRMQVLKRQADWLLHNIIPRHVVEQLKTTSRYSENHREAGILFASIVNFHELYDESYEGGRECLRVLNELVGDFDELLSKPQFRNVTKIKTIGATFMAASGLNPKLRRENPHPFTHLFELIDFALAMHKVIEDFNLNLLEFKFILRIGYAHGDITAGVIGTTKLYYDIWGDAVNTASRMDSYGMPNRIQVPEHCLPVLSEMYTFKARGSMYIKGKDHMNVYLLESKKGKQLHKIPFKRQQTIPAQL